MHRIASCLFLFLLAISSAAAQETHRWKLVADNKTGERNGATLVFLDDIQLFLLMGSGKDASFIKTFDSRGAIWKDFNNTGPTLKDGKRDEIQPYYQTAYDSGSQAVYCLSGTSLHAFNVTDQTWKKFPPAPELDGLHWQTMACDSAGKRLVVVGADRKLDNLGWVRTVVFDIPTGKWQQMDVEDAKTVDDHKARVAAREALIDLGGRIRLAWYRDPHGIGTDAERTALSERFAELKKRAALEPFFVDLGKANQLLAEKKTLDALKAVRAVQRTLEEQTDAQYPVPSSRRNAPLVFDEKNKVFVLFGGDHEDYLMNDTWILDVGKRSWRRMKVDLAPSPRAGHALVSLPRCGKIALYGGYVQSDGIVNVGDPARPIVPVQLWLYDVRANRWDFAGSWKPKDNGDDQTPQATGHFFGYSSQFYSPPPLAVDDDDMLVLASDGNGKGAGSTWTFRVDPAKIDAAGREMFGETPNQRRQRTGPFLASFCEVAEAAPEMKLDELPTNQWVKLLAAPRNPCRGVRGRDSATAYWDGDRDQILFWGGGRGVRAASSVAHYSPVSGRFVEGFDADEPYARMGTLSTEASLWNRPFVPDHNNRRYAYDPKSRLLISSGGHAYDPERMDWLRLDPAPPPFRNSSAAVLASSKHGVVAWAHKKTWGNVPGLWLYDHPRGWIDLEPKGNLRLPYSGTHGMAYDAKRDRMVMNGIGGGYDKSNDGSLLAFDFATKKLEAIEPANIELNKTFGTVRELVYVEHADWLLIGRNIDHGPLKTGKCYTRVYDCAKNTMFLLDAGPVADGFNAGWVYDPRRKLVYVLNHHGEAWALKIDAASAQRIETLPK